MARCKYGKLKNPVGGRRCKKRRSARSSKRKAGRGRRAHRCKHGKLKFPRGRRICKKA